MSQLQRLLRFAIQQLALLYHDPALSGQNVHPARYCTCWNHKLQQRTREQHRLGPRLLFRKARQHFTLSLQWPAHELCLQQRIHLVPLSVHYTNRYLCQRRGTRTHCVTLAQWPNLDRRRSADPLTSPCRYKVTDQKRSASTTDRIQGKLRYCARAVRLSAGLWVSDLPCYGPAETFELQCRNRFDFSYLTSWR